MNLSLVRSSALSALLSHIGGLGTLFLLALFGMKSEDPRAMLLWLGVIALIVGALLCGVITRSVGQGISGSLLATAFYILPVLIAWAFGGQNSAGANTALTLPVKLGILAGCAGIILTLSLALPKGSGSLNRSRRRASIHRSVERRLR